MGLPPFSLFRFPERYGLLVTLGAMLIAANGLEALADRERAPRGVALVWLVAGAALVVLGALSGALSPLEPAAVRTGGALLAAAAVWWWLAPRRPVAFGLLALLCAADAFVAARADVMTLPAAGVAAHPPYAGAIAASGARLWRDNATLRAFDAPVRGADAFALEQRTLAATYASALPGTFGVDELGGYSPVALTRMVRVLLAVPRPVSWRLFGVEWVVTTDQAARAYGVLAKVGDLSTNAALYRTRGRAPRAWAPGRVIDVDDFESSLAAMQAPGFDPGTVAVREVPPGTTRLADARGAVRVVVEPRRSPNHIRLQVDSANDAALVLVAESYAAGWSARVAGVRRPVEIADGALMGVVVPRGRSRVELDYAVPLLPAGFALTLASALALVIVMAWSRRSERAT